MLGGTAAVERVFREEHGRLIASLVRLNWATEVTPPSSVVSAGRACRYRSMEIGPRTVKSSRSMGRNRQNCGCAGWAGGRYVVVIRTTLWPSNATAESLKMGVLAGHPGSAAADLGSDPWTTEPRCASS
jgi:hypothetical protein